MDYFFDYHEVINGAVVWSLEDCRARLERDAGTGGDWHITGIIVDGVICRVEHEGAQTTYERKLVEVDLPNNHPLFNKLLMHLLNNRATVLDMDEQWNEHRKEAA